MDLGHRSIHRSDLTPIDTSPLHVVTCISNPVRYRSRYHLYRRFAKHVADSGGKLWTVEVAFGERPFEVTSPDNPQDIQLRVNHEPWHSELWHKENMLNVAVSRLPQDWKYVAWVDADVQFQRPDWVHETVHQLQHYHFVQMFSTAIDMGPHPSLEPMQTHMGFAYCHHHQHLPKFGIPKLTVNAPKTCLPYYPLSHDKRIFWHPGFAWASRRDAWQHVGGLLDTSILGAADHHMALALVGRAQEAMPPDVTAGYRKSVMDWQLRCDKHIRRNIGYVPGMITHGWHGKKVNRRYWDRWRILTSNQFDPYVDLKRDWQGLLLLIDHGEERSLALRDQIRAYFRQREEDGIDI